MTRLTDRLQEQSKKTGVKQVDIARELGITQQAVNNLFNGRANSSSHWREIAKMLEMTEEEMRELMIESGRDPEKNTKLPTSEEFLKGVDFRNFLLSPNAKIIDEVIPMTKPGRMLPVLGEAVGGDDGEYLFNGSVLDYVACPPSLVNVPNAYSVFVDGESMSPRYRSGETVYVHPTKPARRGDDVIVQIRANDESLPPHGFIKEMVGWQGNKLVLHQYNPEKRIEFYRDEVVSVHPIVLSGKYI